jgi:hypothetical protein
MGMRRSGFPTGSGVFFQVPATDPWTTPGGHRCLGRQHVLRCPDSFYRDEGTSSLMSKKIVPFLFILELTAIKQVQAQVLCDRLSRPWVTVRQFVSLLGAHRSTNIFLYLFQQVAACLSQGQFCNRRLCVFEKSS